MTFLQWLSDEKQANINKGPWIKAQCFDRCNKTLRKRWFVDDHQKKQNPKQQQQQQQLKKTAQQYQTLSTENTRLNQCFKDVEFKLGVIKAERNQLDSTYGIASPQWQDALAQLEIRHLELETALVDLQDLNEQLTVSNAMLLDLKYQAERAQAHAIACDREKTEFLARMSHEIRSPLSVILGYAEQIIEDDVDKATCQQVAGQIRTTSHFLSDVINEVLDVSKIEAGAFTLASDTTDLCQLIHDVYELLNQAACKKGIEFKLDFTFPLPQFLQIDGHRLKQVLINLCSNAIKFTDHGSVQLRVRFVNAIVFIEVEDSGIGMSADQLSHIFLPFTQAEETISARFGGTGLGLFIAYKIVEQMGGQLQVSSTVAQGSCFSIELPIHQAHIQLVSHDSHLNIVSQKPAQVQALSGRIIVAEDTKDLQIIIGAALRKAGLDVILVGNGQQAVDSFKKGSIDLVLLDIEMPVLGGVLAFEAIRAWETEQNLVQVPILALTAHAFKDELDRLAQVGFDDVITKPFQRQSLFNVLGHWLVQQA